MRIIRLLLVADGRVLNDHQQKVFIRCHHDLVLLRTNSQERQIILRVQVANHRARLRSQLGDVRSIFVGQLVVHALRRADWDTIGVD